MAFLTTAFPIKTTLVAPDSKRVPYNMSAPWRAQNVGPLPPWRGSGALSGTAPSYVVTYAGSPTTAVLDLFDRATNIYIMSTTADPVTGAFSFSGLNTSRLFDVRARGDGFTPDENDLFLAGVTPG